MGNKKKENQASKKKKNKTRTRLSGKTIQKMVAVLGGFVYDEIWDEDAGVKLGDVVKVLGTVQAIYAIKNAESAEDIEAAAEALAEINRNVCMPIAAVMVDMASRDQLQDQLQETQDQPTIH